MEIRLIFNFRDISLKTIKYLFFLLNQAGICPFRRMMETIRARNTGSSIVGALDVCFLQAIAALGNRQEDLGRGMMKKSLSARALLPILTARNRPDRLQSGRNE
jgi:hypothetical protein